jgi:MipA family protein
MNDSREPLHDTRVDRRGVLPSRAHRIQTLTMSIALGLVSILIVWGASAGTAKAVTSVEADGAASAETDDSASAVANENDELAVPDPFSDKWKFLAGAAVMNGPRYPGSRDDFTRGLPLVSVSYGRYFLGAVPGSGVPAGAGAYLLHTEHWLVGVDIGGDFRQPRRASDDPILHGWGNIPGTARGGMFANYTINWLSVRGSVSDDLGAHHEGVLATLEVEAKYHATQRLTLTIGPEVTWINDQYAKTFFGIDAAQSRIAGVAPYQVKSGIDSVSGSAGALYMLTDHWSLGTHVTYGKLRGDAADSPVTTDKTQRMYVGFVAYRF